MSVWKLLSSKIFHFVGSMVAIVILDIFRMKHNRIYQLWMYPYFNAIRSHTDSNIDGRSFRYRIHQKQKQSMISVKFHIMLKTFNKYFSILLPLKVSNFVNELSILKAQFYFEKFLQSWLNMTAANFINVLFYFKS